MGETAFADAIIRQGEADQFDIFHTNIAVALLVAYQEQMASDVRALWSRRRAVGSHSSRGTGSRITSFMATTTTCLRRPPWG